VTERKNLKLGSLFDGIGGFPYAGSFFGIEPLWASEIMPSAISVTRRHLPDMEHVGDITKLNGATLPPVDIITFGSPCQGLSMAGKRFGLSDPRSGLFAEAIRIIREMREATNGKYPTWAIWENVPGALSSNQGLDFKAVLEAFTEAEVPFPRFGKWSNAGMVRGGGVDLAWCVYNSQHFGVAQRRRRIFLVADFGGERAGEILFIPKSLRGYFETGGTPRQGAAAYALRGTDSTAAENGINSVGFDGYNGCLTGQQAATLGVNCGMSTGRNGVIDKPNCLNPWDTQQSRVFTDNGQSPTLAGADGGGGRNPAGLLCTAGFLHNAGTKARSIGFEEERSPTLAGNLPSVVCLNDQGGESICVEKSTQSPTLRSETHGNLPIVCKAVGVHQNQSGDVNTSDAAYTITTASTASARNAPLVAHELYGINATAIGRKPHNGGNGLGVNKETAPTLTATDRHAVGGCVHPEIAGTLCASGAGLSRPGGMGSETDLCVAYCLQGSMIGREDKNGPLGGGINEDVSFTLNTIDRHAVTAAEYSVPVAFSLDSAESNSMKSKNPNSGCRVVDTARTIDTTVPCPSKNQGGIAILQSDAHTFIQQRSDKFSEGDVASTQTARQHKDSTDLVCTAMDCRNYKEIGDISGTLQAKNAPGYSLNFQNPVRMGYIVRRLTPTECERLQGYPDGWTASGEDGKVMSDTARYMMLGNSVAVPCVAYILMGIASVGGNIGNYDDSEGSNIPESDNDSLILFDGHGHDARYNGPLSVSPTVSAAYGAGGGNIPLVLCTESSVANQQQGGVI